MLNLLDHYMYHGKGYEITIKNKKPFTKNEKRYKEENQQKKPEYRTIQYKRKPLKKEKKEE